jgi:RNA-directed DNA polymerase
MLKRITDAKRMRAKLHALKGELRRRRHLPVPDQGRWLASVLRGHYNYYAVPATATRSRPSRTRRPGTGMTRFGAAASAPA